jgi:hypothetical protein
VVVVCVRQVEKVSTWLSRTSSDILESGDYGTSLTHVTSLLENLELCKQQIELLEDVPAQLLEWATADSMELHRVGWILAFFWGGKGPTDRAHEEGIP